MNKEIKKFIKICKRPQMKLKSYLYTRLKEFGYDVISEDGFLLAKGGDIMVTAHMDTVHKENVKDVKVEAVWEFEKRVAQDQWVTVPSTSWKKKYGFTTYDLSDKDSSLTVVSSPQGIGGDDRCGIYMIIKILEAGYRPTVLFCEDEEIGGVGSNKFVKSKHSVVLDEMKYLIELDRKGYNDAVFYDCDNKDFHEYILKQTGFIKDFGSFSDIGHLSPEGDVASVNLSCGYYKAHTTDEYVIFEEMENVIEVVKGLLDDEKNVKEKFDYCEVKYISWYDSYCDKSYATASYIDDYVVTVNVNNKDYMGVVDARDDNEAVVTFMLENPELRFSYDDITFLGTYDEFWDTFGGDPYDVFGIAEDEYEDYAEDFNKVNNFILDSYQKPQQDTFYRVV